MRYDDAFDEDFDEASDDTYVGDGQLSEALRDVLRADLRDVAPEALDDALAEVMESMSAAESFNFAKALQQIGQSATQLLSDPTVNQVLRTAVPIAAGVAGTYFGGPAGGKIASELGSTLVNALPGAASRATGARLVTTAAAAPAAIVGFAGTPPASPVAGGSAAAAQGLVLTQHPDVLKALMSLALGQAGRQSVNGVPVPQIMTMLSDVFGRAAAHADELSYMHPEPLRGEETGDEVRAPNSHALYITLMDADSYELAEIFGGAP